MRSLFIFVAIAMCVIACGPSNAQDSPAPNSLSPDKKWEYVGGENPKLVKAGTNDVAIDFLEQCDLGAAGEGSRVLWAPDSRRLAFYSCGAGKELLTLLYQLRDDQWTALKQPNDNKEISDRTDKIIQAQKKRNGLGKGTPLHMQWWKIEPRQWLDANNLIVYASLAEVHRGDGDDILSFGADLLLTLKFDNAGKWKIAGAHEMTGKAVESPSLSSPLANETLYVSPQGNYRIQASADGSALWIVPTTTQAGVSFCEARTLTTVRRRSLALLPTRIGCLIIVNTNSTGTQVISHSQYSPGSDGFPKRRQIMRRRNFTSLGELLRQSRPAGAPTRRVC